MFLKKSIIRRQLLKRNLLHEIVKIKIYFKKKKEKEITILNIIDIVRYFKEIIK